MAKQKGFHEKVVQKMKRDAGFAWTGSFIADMRALVEGSAARAIRADHPIVGEGFIASLQQEAIIRASDERLRRSTGKGLDDSAQRICHIGYQLTDLEGNPIGSPSASSSTPSANSTA